MTIETGKTALVLGATGGVGGETARALISRGWRVRALARRPDEARTTLPQATWIGGDAMNPADVRAAASGASLIVHGVNPPGYRNWRELALPMLDSAIAAARDSGARIVFPGTVYNYGPDAFPLVAETAAQRPLTRKGAIRVEMEQRLERAADAGVRTLIVRAGDFFGPRTRNSWFAQGLVKPGAPLKSISYPGDHDAGHAWAYLPDLAETIARLVAREDDLAAFDTFHFGGHWFGRGVEMAERIRHIAGPDLRIRGFPWLAIRAGAPFVPLFRELAEMRYLWREPLQLDNRKLVGFLGADPHTLIDAALRVTLEALGCLGEPVHDAAGNGVAANG